MTAARTEFKRLPERGTHDRQVIDAILDEAYLCHVGITDEHGPIVIPTLYARDADTILLHGSPASRLLRTARNRAICVTVTLTDGFVLARSAFHHSMNYRSVMVFGTPEGITDDREKQRALGLIVEHLVPGRNPFLRPMSSNEVKGTTVLRLPLDHASAKVRTGPPEDDEEDYELPIWAGVLPITTGYGEPVVDPALTHHVEVPDHVTGYMREART